MKKSLVQGWSVPSGLKKTMLPWSVKPPNTDIPADSGGAVTGGFSWQQPGKPPSCWEMDVRKSHRGSQQTMTNIHKNWSFISPRELGSKHIFHLCVGTSQIFSRHTPLGFKSLTLYRSQTELIFDFFLTTPDSGFWAQVPSHSWVNLRAKHVPWPQVPSVNLRAKHVRWPLSWSILPTISTSSNASRILPPLTGSSTTSTTVYLSSGPLTYPAYFHFGPAAVHFPWIITHTLSFPAVSHPVGSQCP